jgi:tRNA-modifying protein YgfZ
MDQLTFPLTRLSGRIVLSVEGPEAIAFLQGILSADIQSLQEGQATHAALLTPQGKILYDFFVLKIPEGFLLDCSRNQKDELLKRLTFYKLRAKVQIGEKVDWGVGVSLEEPQARCRFADPREPRLGWRTLAPFANLPLGGDELLWRKARIQLGLADTDEDIGSAELFPHEANLDQLGGVSFSKGCFVGQEVVSRMQHRGTARKRILPVSLATETDATKSEIKAGGSVIGTVLSQDGLDALALIRLDRLAEAIAAGDRLLTNGVEVHVKKPAWARFEVPEPKAA